MTKDKVIAKCKDLLLDLPNITNVISKYSKEWSRYKI